MAGLFKGLLVGLGAGLLLFLLFTSQKPTVIEADSPMIVEEAAVPEQVSPDSPPLPLDEAIPEPPPEIAPPVMTEPDTDLRTEDLRTEADEKPLAEPEPEPEAAPIEEEAVITSVQDAGGKNKPAEPQDLPDDEPLVGLGFAAPDLSMPPDARSLLNTQE